MLHNRIHSRTPETQPAGFGDVAIDLSTCTFGELAYFCAGILHGAQSQAQRDDERAANQYAALHSRAATVVHSMAEVPERDAEADAQRAAKRAAWWTARREGRPE